MTPDPIRISADKEIHHLTSLMRAYHVRRVPIVKASIRSSASSALDDLIAEFGSEMSAIGQSDRRGIPPRERLRGVMAMSDITEALREEHKALLPHIDDLRLMADRLDEMAQDEVRRSLDRVYQFLTVNDYLMRRLKKTALYPAVANILGSPQATATMSRDHVEVTRLTEQLGWLRSQGTSFDLEQMKNLRRVLYSLHALLKVHFAKEEEVYLPLLESHLSNVETHRLLRKMAAVTARTVTKARSLQGEQIRFALSYGDRSPARRAKPAARLRIAARQHVADLRAVPFPVALDMSEQLRNIGKFGGKHRQIALQLSGAAPLFLEICS